MLKKIFSLIIIFLIVSSIVTTNAQEIKFENKDAWMYSDYVELYDANGILIFDELKQKTCGYDITFDIPTSIWNQAKTLKAGSQFFCHILGYSKTAIHKIDITDEFKTQHKERMIFSADGDSNGDIWLLWNHHFCKADMNHEKTIYYWI